MTEPEDPAEEAFAAIHQEVVEILDSKRPMWNQAEHVIACMSGYTHIAGQKQGVGEDRPFDLRSPKNTIQIDVKTQSGGELDIKKEKPGKQFTAWSLEERQFVPLQLVLDRLTQGWYIVPGIPAKMSEVVLDPTVKEFDQQQPLTAFMIGRCLLEELRDLKECKRMAENLMTALETIEHSSELINEAVNEQYFEFLESLEGNAFKDPLVVNLIQSSAFTAVVARSEEAIDRIIEVDEAAQRMAQSETVIDKVAQSQEAMERLAKSQEAMERLAKSEQAMEKIIQVDEAAERMAQSETVIDKVAQSQEAMERLAKSQEAMERLAKSEQAIDKIAGSEEGLSNLRKKAKKDPAWLAQFLASLQGDDGEPST